MERFITNHSEYIKEWRLGNVRILKETADKCFLSYRVHQFNGKSWSLVKVFHTLPEAKRAARWVAEDMAMDAAIMG